MQITSSTDKIIIKTPGVEREFRFAGERVQIEARIIEHGVPRTCAIVGLAGADEIAAVAEWFATVAEAMQQVEAA